MSQKQDGQMLLFFCLNAIAMILEDGFKPFLRGGLDSALGKFWATQVRRALSIGFLLTVGHFLFLDTMR